MHYKYFSLYSLVLLSFFSAVNAGTIREKYEDTFTLKKGGRLILENTNGSIKVYFPRDFRAYIDARTTNGSIKTDFPIKVRGEISKRRLRGSINNGGGNIDLHTTNGGIKILEK